MNSVQPPGGGGALALRPQDLDPEQCLILLPEKGETVRWQPVSVKLLSSPGSGRILGGVVVAPHASELILAVSLAVEQRLTVEQLEQTFAAALAGREKVLPRDERPLTGPTRRTRRSRLRRLT